ncbi:MAG: error-prone DNA polymerase [Pseudomonadota bacterium]
MRHLSMTQSGMPSYCELQVTSNFSFLQSGSHPDEFVAQAKALGLSGLALTDRNTLAGVVRAHVAAKSLGLPFLVGARLDLIDGPSLLCFPRSRAAYGRLCRLLTLGQRRAEKGECHLYMADVVAHCEGQVFVVLPPEDWDWRGSSVLYEGRVTSSAQPPLPAGAPAFAGAVSEPAFEPVVSNILPFPNPHDSLDGLNAEKAETGEATGNTKKDWHAQSANTACLNADTACPGDTFADHVAYLCRVLRRLNAAGDGSLAGDQDGRLDHGHGHTETRVYLAAHVHYRGDDRPRLRALKSLADRQGVQLVATGDVVCHARHRKLLCDVLTCVRHGVTIDKAGYHLQSNSERHLKSSQEMQRLFKGFEDCVERTAEIFSACDFSLDELVYEYPDEPVPEGATPQGHLEALTREGALWRYPDGVPEKVQAALRKELSLIAQLNYAPYFLTVHDIVAFARSQNILAQGRGSAANSAVCYCLGITAVDPAQSDLLFERFISSERKEPPDIDVDFEHERREEVIQYIYARYGRDRAGLAATVISYRMRSAVRDVGKAMGLSEDTVAALSGMVWGFSSGSGLPEKHVREAGLDPADARLAIVLELAAELTGFPRHLSQHVGGFVLTRGPLSEVVPVGNARMADRTTVEWDKDDLAALGLLKIDVLALGMLSCVHRAFDLIADHYNRPLTLARVPQEDPATYDMLCRADSIGVFQVESRAQMNMLPRLKPKTFYDLVIEVAIVRPGPIQGDMVHPYLRRRDGLEPEVYPSPAPEFGPPDELRRILGRTKGVPLFQEQAMRIAMVAAQFSDADVNELRKAMATFRKRGTIGLLQDKMITAMSARGYDRAFAERCFNQIKGFGEYGFPESHAASFALLVYVSSWIKCHYPDVFCCALLNSQPMGFYAPAQIVRDAREHGVEVLPVDIMHSEWDCTLEPVEACHRGDDDPGKVAGKVAGKAYENDGKHGGRSYAVRLGFRQVDGLGIDVAQALVEARKSAPRPFEDVRDVQLRSGVSAAALERLASADGFRSMGLDRRHALWAVRGLGPSETLPLFAVQHLRDDGREAPVCLPAMPLSEHVVNDYQTLKLSLKAHPISFLRSRFDGEWVTRCSDLGTLKDGAFVRVAGVVLVRQRPGSAKGVVFMTLEDETGVANAVVWPNSLEKYRKVVMGARLVFIQGRVQRHENIIHVVSQKLEDRSDWLADLSETSHVMDVPIARADEVLRPNPGADVRPRGSQHHPRWAGHPRNEVIIPKSRDFH